MSRDQIVDLLFLVGFGFIVALLGLLVVGFVMAALDSALCG